MTEAGYQGQNDTENSENWPREVAKLLATSPGMDGLIQSFLDGLPAAIYTTDAEGRLTTYNRAAVELWGRQPAVGDRWTGARHLFWPDGSAIDLDQSPLAIAVRDGKPARGIHAVVERPDGSRRHFLAHPSPLWDGQGHIVGGVNMLVDVGDSIDAVESKHRLAAIVESSDDAIISKTLDGKITSWNQAAERLFGYTPDEIVGQSVLTLIPPDRHHEEAEIIERLRRGERIEHFETKRCRKGGELVDISLTISPIKHPDGTVIGASKIARDITEKKRAAILLERQSMRLETLNRVSTLIAGDLDFERIVHRVTDIATDISGAKFGAFFYNTTDDRGDSYMLFALSGASREHFEPFGMPRATAVFAPTFRGDGTVRSSDIRTDPRYGREAPHFGMPAGHLPVVSYLAVPVKLSSGEVLGGLFFGHPESGIFDEESARLIEGIAAQAAVAMDNARLHRAAQAEIEQRKEAERAKELLLHEIKHRVKNTLATIQAIASQTFVDAPPAEKQAFMERLQSLASAHDLLTANNWDDVDLQSVVTRGIRPFEDPDKPRFKVTGLEARITAPRALAVAMTIHELATNAIKYGALSTPNGTVSLTGEELDEDDGQYLKVTWRESGGPRAAEPKRRGFGTRMIERALRGADGQVAFRYKPSGLELTFRIKTSA